MLALAFPVSEEHPMIIHDSCAYSAEDDRLFRRNVTGYSAGSALVGFSTLVGHDQSRFHSFL